VETTVPSLTLPTAGLLSDNPRRQGIDNKKNMHPLLVFQLLMLLLVANGSPVVVKKTLGERFAVPLDGGLRFFDNRPLLGSSKTVRGIMVGIAAPTACAPLIGFDWVVGAVVGSAAMGGDLLSSFVKRRLDRAPSSRATALDQIPESLFPLLACRPLLGLSVLDVVVGTMLFFIGEVLLSRALYRVHLRDRPY
jgi:CDP-2,3-bis-(O-geranylgeranyl)-sn-glycerol synthase